jgi:transposase
LSQHRLSNNAGGVKQISSALIRDLAAQGVSVRVGMEASGHARWFERLLWELHFELWIGDAAEIRSKRVRKQKTDRQDAQLILQFSQLGTQICRKRSSSNRQPTKAREKGAKQ